MSSDKHVVKVALWNLVMWSSCKKKLRQIDVLEKKGPGAKAKEHKAQSPTCEIQQHYFLSKFVGISVSRLVK